MKKIGRFLFCLSMLCVSPLTSGVTWAQGVKGQYAPKPVKPEEEGLPATVPRIFSSQVASAKMAEKLDLKYYDLIIVLSGYADIDLSYRVRMMELLEPYKFQVTRRKEEFAKDITDSKRALNDNYSKTKTLLKNFEADLNEQVKFFPESERETIKEAGKRAIETFEKKSTQYFKLQAQFIKTYDSLVRFILTNGGSYYYDSGRQGVAFYQGGHYASFGKMIDDLNKTNFDQAQLLKSFIAGPPL